jgi:alpha-amylase
MKAICLYFQIHHAFCFQTFRYFDVGDSRTYYDDLRIEKEIQEAATNFYLPTNEFLLKLILQSKGKLKLSFYISGTTIDQFLMYSPQILNSFRKLAETGQVEFLGGTSSHSIASLIDKKDEFKRQILQHRERTDYYFGQQPQVFINTDLIYTNQVGKIAAETGYPLILTNGVKKVLHWRSANYLYSGENAGRIKILFRNEGISNEFSMLLNNPNSLKKANLLKLLNAKFHAIKTDEPIVNIYINYQSMGGLLSKLKQSFFQAFVSRIYKDLVFKFNVPSELTNQFAPVSEIGVNEPICWVDQFHSSYFPGNDLQQEAIQQLFKLEKLSNATKDPNLQADWQYLQTSDHFHLMEDNHPAYLNPNLNQDLYKSKYDAFINFMNIVEDFRQRLKADELLNKNVHDIQKSDQTIADRYHNSI